VTRLRAGSAARLDRVYIPDSLRPNLSHVKVLLQHLSDHCPVAVWLKPLLQQPQFGPGARPINAGFLGHEARAAKFLRSVRPLLAHGMRMTDAALIEWWPKLKRTVALLARGLAREHKAEAQNTTADASRAAAEWEQARGGLLQFAQQPQTEQVQEAFMRAAAAHARHRRQVATVAGVAAATATDHWLRTREYAHPVITALVRPRPPPTAVPGLQVLGRVESQPQAMAAHAVRHYAGVSALRPTDAHAVSEVIGAMRSQQQSGLALRIEPADAHSAGAQEVTVAEVQAAITRTSRGKAPGLDGIPIEVWAAGDMVWAPLLARLFTAVGKKNLTPVGFLEGVVSPHLKSAECDPTLISNYRPIQLLNADYRLLARVLASRFATAMSPSIGAEHTAFLPGRQIGDNIRLSQLVPAALAAQAQSGALVFLDVQKAYDTLDRQFLYACMEQHGASAGMLAWAQLLHTGTRARALINGVCSPFAEWQAGVRQGCPLAPVLFLFAAEALACWLRAQPGLGVSVQGHRVVSSHHADDTKVFVPECAPAPVGALLQAMDVYARASNQVMHPQKSAVMPVGQEQQPPPQGPVGGLPLVCDKVALGVLHTNTAVLPAAPAPYALRQPRLPPEALPSQAQVDTRWAPRMGKLHRALAAARRLPASAMGTGLWSASYGVSCLLYHAEHEGLPGTVAAQAHTAVARAVDRAGRASEGLPGLHSHQVYDSPGDGGFGALPLLDHITARHIHTALGLFHTLLQHPRSPCAPWQLLAEHVLSCVCPGAHPVQALLLMAYSSRHEANAGVISAWSGPYLQQRMRVPCGILRHIAVALARVGSLSCLQENAQVDVLAWLQREPRTVQELRDQLQPWGWKQGALSVPVTGGKVPVRDVTRLLRHTATVERQDLHRATVSQVLQQSPASQEVARATARVRATMKSVWRVPMDNRVKEVWWRLMLNAVPSAGGHGICLRGQCACGFALSAQDLAGRNSAQHRQHVFWDCPVAREVREQLRLGLRSAPQASVQRQHVWLLRAPQQSGCCAVVWQAVALAAMAAMDSGRRTVWALTAGRPGANAAAVAAAGRTAAVHFWRVLQDFAHACRKAPSSAWDSITVEHPFLRRADPVRVLDVQWPEGVQRL
jgi:hypothetical protein